MISEDARISMSHEDCDFCLCGRLAIFTVYLIFDLLLDLFLYFQNHLSYLKIMVSNKKKLKKQLCMVSCIS